MEVQLWKIRKAAGITTVELASRSGVSKSEINEIENNKRDPRFGTLEKIAEALDCKINDFVKSSYLK